MNGMPSNSFSRIVVKPTIMVVLLVLVALGSTARDSFAVRAEVDIGNAQFPSSTNCNACQKLLTTLTTGGQTNACATPNPACNLPTFPTTGCDGTAVTINSATAITGGHLSATNTNYPYVNYCGGLTVTNGTFTGPASTGFLTVYVTGNLSVTTATTNNNVRFVVSGNVDFPSGSVFTVNNPAVTIMSNTVTAGNQPVWINFPGGCDYHGSSYQNAAQTGPATPGDPNNLLIITTGTYTADANGGGNKMCISAGIFSANTLGTGGNSHNQFDGATYSTLCPTNVNNTTNSNQAPAGYTIAPAATNSLTNIDVCAAPGAP